MLVIYPLQHFSTVKIMAKVSEQIRLEQIPVLHVRGTNFAVGYSIGRTFKSQIHNLLDKWSFYKNVALRNYSTPEGKMLYEKSLHICNTKFPHYVEELKGMAEGADLCFHQLFVLHVDTLMVYPCHNINAKLNVKGCTSILSNNEEIVLGHSEDADSEMLNNIYIVSAEIISENGKKIEKFTTLSYAGHLPGYTMGFNEHGMVYSVNTLYPTNVYSDGSPRAFVARDVLRASNLDEALDILRGSGIGVSDGFSLNLYFSKNVERMFNVEIGPGQNGDPESKIDVLTLNKGSSLCHCNRYLRMKLPENVFETNIHRHNAISKHLDPTNVNIIKDILSDQNDREYPIFRSEETEDTKTVAVGIFEISQRKWKIYTGKPNESEPVAVLSLDF